MVLRYADPHLQEDPEIVLAAVSQDGHALQFADILFKGDSTIVMPAIMKTPSAVKHATVEFVNLFKKLLNDFHCLLSYRPKQYYLKRICHCDGSRP